MSNFFYSVLLPAFLVSLIAGIFAWFDLRKQSKRDSAKRNSGGQPLLNISDENSEWNKKALELSEAMRKERAEKGV